MATNFPLVVIRNNATGHLFFARTSSFSTMGIATGKTLEDFRSKFPAERKPEQAPFMW